MPNPDSNSKINIRRAEDENFIDLSLCAKEFLDFINDFRKKFLNKKFFILTAYYENVLAGVLVAEDKNRKIDSIEKILPTMFLHLLFVNPRFRNHHIGKELLESFIETQKENGIASISIKLPQRYKKGIQFFIKNNFHQVRKVKSSVILEYRIWNDYGIRSCEFIDNALSDF